MCKKNICHFNYRQHDRNVEYRNPVSGVQGARTTFRNRHIKLSLITDPWEFLSDRYFCSSSNIFPDPKFYNVGQFH
jgi:hypothetical protein